jgi:hypothetical protein
MALIPDYASEALFDIVSNTVDIAVFAALADSVDLSKADMCKHIAQATKLAVCRESFNESSFKSKKYVLNFFVSFWICVSQYFIFVCRIAEHLIVLILALRGSNNAFIKLKLKEIVETLNTKASTYSLCSEYASFDFESKNVRFSKNIIFSFSDFWRSSNSVTIVRPLSPFSICVKPSLRQHCVQPARKYVVKPAFQSPRHDLKALPRDDRYKHPKRLARPCII